MDLQFCMELIKLSPSEVYSDMHISPTIHYNAGHSYKINTHYNIGADEFVAWK